MNLQQHCATSVSSCSPLTSRRTPTKSSCWLWQWRNSRQAVPKVLRRTARLPFPSSPRRAAPVRSCRTLRKRVKLGIGVGLRSIVLGSLPCGCSPTGEYIKRVEAEGQRSTATTFFPVVGLPEAHTSEINQFFNSFFFNLYFFCQPVPIGNSF